MALIRDIAQVCKSKNASSFIVTIVVLFEDPALYRRLKATGVLSAVLFAQLYSEAEADVPFTPYDTASVFKATLPQLVPAGNFGHMDVYGAQQHAPLLIAQAGGSPRGRRFAAAHADTIVVNAKGTAAIRAEYDDIRRLMVAGDRAPDACRMLYLVNPIIGETMAEAVERKVRRRRRRRRRWCSVSRISAR